MKQLIHKTYDTSRYASLPETYQRLLLALDIL